MKSRPLTFTLMSLAVAFGPAALADQATSDLLEKGVFAQETSGDLDAAITAYGKIVDQAEENRTFVARALYHMGECYLKKGDKAKAMDLFRRVTLVIQIKPTSSRKPESECAAWPKRCPFPADGNCSTPRR